MNENGGNGSSREVKSVLTMFDVLEHLESVERASITEVADAVDITKSTAHRHLHTLYDRGYVVRDGNAYTMGLHFLKLGRHA